LTPFENNLEKIAEKKNGSSTSTDLIKVTETQPIIDDLTV
jgi:hypothetical protein